MPECDVAHEKAALNAYITTQFNTAYTAAPKTYQDRAFSLPFFSDLFKDNLSKTRGMYTSVTASSVGNYSASTGNYISLGSSGTSYTSGSSSGGYSSSSSGAGYSGCSGGGCYK